MSTPTTPARFLCVGTHHKTGTIWMRKVFRAVAKDQDIPFMQMNREQRMEDLPATGPCIVVNWSSSFPEPMLVHPEARFIHMIRDPRDVLLSGMRYHRVAGLGNEKFLRRKRDDLGGGNYQDHLNALPDDHARYLFEMENKHATTVAQMMAWDYKNPSSYELKYEDMIGDTDCALFRKMLEKLDVEGLDIDRAVQTYWDHSLFGGLADPENRTNLPKAHVASGDPAQWRTKLPLEIAEIYVKIYGATLKALKYEKNNFWAKECLPAEKQIVAAE